MLEKTVICTKRCNGYRYQFICLKNLMFSLGFFLVNHDQSMDQPKISKCIKLCDLITERPALGNFEESVLNGRLEPVSTVEGFTAEIGDSSMRLFMIIKGTLEEEFSPVGFVSKTFFIPRWQFADPHHLDVDPDPANHFVADPDPADPEPDPTFVFDAVTYPDLIPAS
jgi:hypothetical protein